MERARWSFVAKTEIYFGHRFVALISGLFYFGSGHRRYTCRPRVRVGWPKSGAPIASIYRRSINSWLYFVLGPVTGFRYPGSLTPMPPPAKEKTQWLSLWDTDTNSSAVGVFWKLYPKLNMNELFEYFVTSWTAFFSTRCRRESNMSSVAKCLCPQLYGYKSYIGYKAIIDMP